MARDRLTLLRGLERGAALMRRAGLGAVVDHSRARMLRRVGDFTADVGGINLSGDTTAHSHYVRQLLDDERERYVADLFAEAVPTGGLVLDIGAHLGYFSLLAARRGARAIAFEPNPATLPYLRRNLADNGAAEQVALETAALGARAETRTFFRAEGGDTSSLHDQGHAVEAVAVRVTTADAVVAGRSVDVIKMDIEGGELDALDGMRETIANASPGLRLFVECNPDALERAGVSSRALIARLRELGLEPSVIDEDARVVRPFGDEPVGASGYVNLVCARAARSALTRTSAT
jgi:FkbM family methyltransferase